MPTKIILIVLLLWLLAGIILLPFVEKNRFDPLQPTWTWLYLGLRDWCHCHQFFFSFFFKFWYFFLQDMVTCILFFKFLIFFLQDLVTCISFFLKFFFFLQDYLHFFFFWQSDLLFFFFQFPVITQLLWNDQYVSGRLWDLTAACILDSSLKLSWISSFYRKTWLNHLLFRSTSLTAWLYLVGDWCLYPQLFITWVIQYLH